MNVDPRLLPSFVALAEELHFGKAAERLHVAQPALSQQMQRLEAQMETQLFTRSTRRVELTEAGQELYARATSALRVLEEAVAAAREIGTGQAGELAVGTTAVGRSILTPTISAAFAREFTNWTVRWQEAHTRHLVHAVAEGTLDVAVVFCAQPVRNVELIPYFEDVVLAAFGQGDPLLGRPHVTVADLADRVIVLADDGAEAYNERVLGIVRDGGLEPGVRIQGYGRAVVEPGEFGITVAVASDDPAGRVPLLPVRTLPFSFATRPGPLRRGVEAFIATARATAALQGWGAPRRAKLTVA